MRIAVVGIAVAIAGCSAKSPIVRTEVVRVPIEIVRQVDPSLLREIDIERPAPACSRDGLPMYCNGQVATMLGDALHAVEQHNADKRAIRREQAARPDREVGG